MNENSNEMSETMEPASSSSVSLTSSPTTSLQSLSSASDLAAAANKNEKFKITLDSPTNTYYSGQTIRGNIALCCKQTKKIRGIYFRIMGYGKCGWTDLLRRESTTIDGKAERSAIKYSGTEEYLNSVLYVIGSKNGPSFVLPEGTSTYDFMFNLRSDLPSSFSGGCGKIKYKMEFVVDKPWKFDEKQLVLLTIIQTVNLNYTSGTLQPFENQLTRNIGYIGSGPLSLHVFIPKSGYTPGEKLPIQVVVSNNSRIHVEKVKFSLNKIVDYHSKTPGMAIKREVQRLLKKEAGGVNKKTEQRYEHVIDVPMTIPSQSAEASCLIHIKYEIRVEAKISGLYKNLVVTIPLTIGNIPHSMHAQSDPIPFPSLPDLPPGLSIRSAPLATVGFNVHRLSMTSNSSFRLVASSSPNDSNPTAYRHVDNRSLSSNSSTSSVPIDSLVSSTNSSNAANTSHQLPDTISIEPSAPPLDLSAMNLSYASMRSSTVFLDAPPSYDEVFGSPSSSSATAATNRSNSSSLHNTSEAKT